jgi:serine/threonine protein kinase/formylglycine-generating enzyme required for sulfatase activity
MNDPADADPLDQTLPDPPEHALPSRIGRYRVIRPLGEGGFGVVYLARDEQLERDVAIKVPHRGLVSGPEDAEAYLAEARTVAGLDHPNLIPVHDVGSSEDFPCFVVSQYIEGSTLAEKLREGRPSLSVAIPVVITVAETLHYAHRKGVVHRDVKPGNILIDASGKPFVADFGLAIKEEDVGRGPRYAGTPAYMSPEQARGEGHRVDGRTDIFSLGVVFYELLTGKKPFHAATRDELFQQIVAQEPRPPRQRDDRLPKELERICLKALSKRASDRYTTARDFADDLRQFQQDAPRTTEGHVTPFHPQNGVQGEHPSRPPTATTQSSGEYVKVIPKGLRSFDEHDGDFFLELLEGPRDRNGLPESIRFWKTRLEERWAAEVFAVGLLYGPSGCGKSSLVRAGLLPRLAEHVVPVYVEATPEETERRLLHGLRSRFPGAGAEWGLKETMTALRLGSVLPEGRKALVILDQFEQWLHARGELNTELPQALRQCDGSHVQCLVMVRDDFYLAVNRFFRELEVPIQEGLNSALVDLFDPDHARRLLIAFGRAYGRLPQSSAELSAEQRQFLDRAVAELAGGGKVAGVRLTLFAEMMKGRPWSPESLRAIGGAEGAGVTFLEETFGSRTAPPTHRVHQDAARAVLRTLLPETGTDIKGQMQPAEKLLEASGYAGRPSDFKDLLRILVGELRLITPTDPEGVVERGDSGELSRPESGERHPSRGGRGGRPRYYQLTHDFLVPAVREWLTRNQKETPAGRAQLLLAERASFWAARPESKQLPSFLEWLNIVGRTDRSRWSEPQRRMMRAASRRHLARLLAGAAAVLGVAVLAAALIAASRRQRREETARGLVEALLKADLAHVAGTRDELSSLPGDWRTRLGSIALNDSSPVEKRLRASLALVRDEPRCVGFLVHQLLDADPAEFTLILRELRWRRRRCVEELWPIATLEANAPDRRLHAAAALAELDPDGEKWPLIARPTAEALVRVNLLSAPGWIGNLRPAARHLLGPLEEEFGRAGSPEARRTLVAGILADYGRDDPALLARLIQKADSVQFPLIMAAIEDAPDRCIPMLSEAVSDPLESLAGDKGERTHARANAATALLLLQRPEVVGRDLGQGVHPDSRTVLINKLPELVPFSSLRSLPGRSRDELLRQAILLAADGYRESGRLSQAEKEALEREAFDLFENDESAAVHSAAEWLLRRLGEGERVDGLIAQLSGREKQGWRVTKGGHTLAKIPGPVEFRIGSPGGEPRRDGGEDQFPWRIPYSYEIGTHEVTVAQFKEFFPDHRVHDVAPTPDCPMNNVSWYDVAKYCRRLDEAEGLDKDQMIFPPVDQIGPDLELPEGWLGRRGHRMPTEAEWEYACRARTTTIRFFGAINDPATLYRYGWCQSNSNERCAPTGSLRPNPFGLFDVLGNVAEWCVDRRRDYAAAPAYDDESVRIVRADEERIFRGATYQQMTKDLRSAKRDSREAKAAYSYTGFRIARTVPTASPDRPLPNPGRTSHP